MSKPTLALLASLLALASGAVPTLAAPAGPPAAAASAATGTISGRVQNVVTGQYLNKARVTLKGTTQEVFTDSFGNYQLVGVPSGPAVVEIFYTDLDLATHSVTVPAGGIVERNGDLTSVKRYGTDANTVRLDAFVVSQDKETDNQAMPPTSSASPPTSRTSCRPTPSATS